MKKIFFVYKSVNRGGYKKQGNSEFLDDPASLSASSKKKQHENNEMVNEMILAEESIEDTDNDNGTINSEFDPSNLLYPSSPNPNQFVFTAIPQPTMYIYAEGGGARTKSFVFVFVIIGLMLSISALVATVAYLIKKEGKPNKSSSKSSLKRPKSDNKSKMRASSQRLFKYPPDKILNGTSIDTSCVSIKNPDSQQARKCGVKNISQASFHSSKPTVYKHNGRKFKTFSEPSDSRRYSFLSLNDQYNTKSKQKSNQTICNTDASRYNIKSPCYPPLMQDRKLREFKEFRSPDTLYIERSNSNNDDGVDGIDNPRHHSKCSSLVLNSSGNNPQNTNMASKSNIFPPSKRKTCASSDSIFMNDDSGKPLTRFSRIETGVPNRPDYRFILNKKCVYDADGDDENYLLTSFVNFDKAKDTSRSYSGEEITKRRARDDANALYYIKNIRHPHSSDDQSYNRSRSKSSKNESKGEYCSDEIWQKKSATLSNRFADYDCEMPKPVKNFTKTRGPHVICFEDDLRNFGHKPSPKAPRKESSGVSNTDKFKDFRFDKANTAEGYDNNMRSCFDQIRSSLLSSEGQAIDSNGGPEQYYISNRTHLLQPSTLKSSEKYEYL